MELNKQVCSLELAQKMKELGFKQESFFYWYEDFDIEALENCRCGGYHGGDGIDRNFDSTGINIHEKGWKIITHKIISPRQAISAYTVAELYSLLYSYGICDILITVKPEELADYLAEMLCKKLQK